MIRVIDLHVHTTASDGSYTPAGVVELAKKAGLAAIAITDHDTVHGVNEAVQAAANESLEVVPGVEISVGDTDNMHILGLYIDPGSAPLQDKLRFLKDSRRKRNEQMIQKLREQGFPLSYDEIASETGAENIGRLHIAYYMQKKGLVNDYRKVFRQYIVKGGSAYVEREKISERDGIETILQAGGLPFLAHISYLRMSNSEIDRTVKRLKGYGLAGIEAFYSGYNKETEQFANALCEKYQLLKSGGTDFHGTRRMGVYLGTGRGNMCVPYALLAEIKKHLRQLRNGARAHGDR